MRNGQLQVVEKNMSEEMDAHKRTKRMLGDVKRQALYWRRVSEKEHKAADKHAPEEWTADDLAESEHSLQKYTRAIDPRRKAYRTLALAEAREPLAPRVDVVRRLGHDLGRPGALLVLL